MIKITIGVANSGKSTWAHQEWNKDPENTIIINRDKIRELLFSYTERSVYDYYKRSDFNKLEKRVTKYEDTLIYEALSNNKKVIVDATHLKKEYITRFEYWNVSLELVWFDITLKEALTRNISRDRKVSEDIIKKQYNRYVDLRKNFSSYSFNPKSFKQNKNLPPCIIYDIDGTISKMKGRSPYDWDKVDEDFVISNVVTTIDWLADLSILNRPKVILCTGRDGKALDKTKQWLLSNSIYADKLYIRTEGDNRPDWIVKEEMWEEIASENYIVGMYDDRLQVVRRARALGLKVFNVEYNNF